MGWVWIPDTVWSPAWVAWRDSDDYVGWAPLPPDEDIDADVVFEPVIEPAAFTFVRTRYFVDPVLVRYLEPPSRSVVIVRSTVNATRFSIEGSRVIDRGLAVGRIERVIGRPVPRLTIEVSAAAGPTRELRDRVVVYRPLNAAPSVIRQPGRVVVAAPTHRTGFARTATPPAERPVPERGAPPRPAAGGAVPRGAVNGPNAARHQQALQALERQQNQERADLERRHARERQHPPNNISPRALNERQAAETRELLTRQERQRKELEGRRD